VVYLEADEENGSYEFCTQVQVLSGDRVSHLFDRPGAL
jgi:hypothetical protein